MGKPARHEKEENLFMFVIKATTLTHSLLCHRREIFFYYEIEDDSSKYTYNLVIFVVRPESWCTATEEEEARNRVRRLQVISECFVMDELRFITIYKIYLKLYIYKFPYHLGESIKLLYTRGNSHEKLCTKSFFFHFSCFFFHFSLPFFDFFFDYFFDFLIIFFRIFRFFLISFPDFS